MPLTSDLPKLPRQESLLKPHPPVSNHETIFSKKFPASDYHISLRPFCILTDMQAIHQWAWKTSSAASLLATSYAYTHESTFAKSFMVFINDSIPVCQADLCSSQQDDICEYYSALPGDHIVRLLAILQKKKDRQFYIDVLQTCMEFFFSDPAVGRLLIEPDVEDERYNDLVIHSGFRFQQRIYQSYKVSNLYYCKRNQAV